MLVITAGIGSGADVEELRRENQLLRDEIQLLWPKLPFRLGQDAGSSSQVVQSTLLNSVINHITTILFADQGPYSELGSTLKSLWFQGSFRAVSEQFQSSFRGVSEQFSSSFRAVFL